jgi:hypothetical protein
MLVQRKVAGVEGQVGLEEELEALEEGALDPGWLAPEEAVVDEEDLGAEGGCPPDALGAGVHGEGDAAHRVLAPPYLDAIEGVVDAGEGFDLEHGPAEDVEVAKQHGGEHSAGPPEKKRASRGRRHDPGRLSGLAADVKILRNVSATSRRSVPVSHRIAKPNKKVKYLDYILTKSLASFAISQIGLARFL